MAHWRLMTIFPLARQPLKGIASFLPTILLPLCLLFFAFFCAISPAAAKGIHATVQASWTETALLQEGCEWAASTRGAQGFYDCLEALRPAAVSSEEGSEATGARAETQVQQYARLQERVVAAFARGDSTQTQRLSDGQQALFAVEMAARLYSPTVEAHYTLATGAITSSSSSQSSKVAVESICRDGKPFVLVQSKRGRVVATLDDVASLASALSSTDQGSDKATTTDVKVDLTVIAGLDHVHPVSTAARAGAVPRTRLVVLYGLVGERATMQLYDTVVKQLLASDPTNGEDITFVVRHLPVHTPRLCASIVVSDATAPPAWTAQPLFVQGYGATVDLKNMEYKVVDEKKKHAGAEDTTAEGASADGDAASIGAGAAESGEIGGFDIVRLKARHPDLAVQLDSFASAMEDELGKAEAKVDLDAVETQNIGLAAAQYVVDAKPEEQLAVLADVVNRFPSYAARLGRLAMQTSRLAEVQDRVQRSSIRLPPSGAAMFVNGVLVRDKELSLFGVLERLRAEETYRDQARDVLAARPPPRFGEEEEETRTVVAGQTSSGRGRFVLPDVGTAAAASLERVAARTQRRLSAYRAAHPLTAPRVALPLSALSFLNDIETSPVFAGLPRKLSAALQSMPGGQQLMPRRNIVHAAVLVDVANPRTWRLLAQLFSVVGQGIFARVGVAVVDPEWSVEHLTMEDDPAQQWRAFAGGGGGGGGSRDSGRSPASHLSMALAAVLAYASRESRYYELGGFLQRLMLLDYQSQLTAETLMEAAAASRVLDAEDGLTDLLTEPAFQTFYLNQQLALRRLGLVTPADASALPAIFVNGRKVQPVSGGEVAHGAFQMIMEEIEHVRELIRADALTDAMKDLYAAVLEHEGATATYQQALDASSMDTFQYSTLAITDFLYTQPFLYPVEAETKDTDTKEKPAKAATATKDTSKAPLVLTSTPTSSVLVLPSHGGVANAAWLLSEALAAHSTSPSPLSTSVPPHRKRLSKRSREGSEGEDEDEEEEEELEVAVESGGAARFTVLFADESSATKRPGSSVRDCVEALLAHDARVIARTGRHSDRLAAYAAWLHRAAVARGSKDTQRMRLDDPSSQAALEKVQPLPTDVKTLLLSLQQGAISTTATRATQVSQTAVRVALRAQLGHYHTLETGVQHPQPQLSHPLLLLNGNVVAIADPDSFSASDFRYLLKASAGPASLVYRQLWAIPYAQLTSQEGGFRADDLDSGFFSGKTAALDSLLTANANRRWNSPAVAAVGVAEPMMERKVLPPLAAMGKLAFTLHPSSTGTATTNKEDNREAVGHHQHHQHHRHRITIAVDPAAREAQLVVSLAEFFLRSSLDVSVTVYLQPSLQVPRPIRDLYTLVASPTLQFDPRTGSVVAPAAVFRALPTTTLLTLGIEEPPSWTVFSHEAEYDLDNIILAKLPRHRQFVTAAYRIQSLLVAGSVLNMLGGDATAEPAAGLPLTLRPVFCSSGGGAVHGKPAATPAAAAEQTDTLVMETLGYYQLQATAGLFHLSVLPGRFAEAYYIAGENNGMAAHAAPYAAGTDGHLLSPFNVSAGQQIPLLVSSFAGLSLDMYVRPVPSPTPQPDILSIAQREADESRHAWPPPALKDGSTDRTTRPAKPTLNIFSVASGHLYERFLRMMMYSVYNASSDKYGVNTTRIKFWVIENFLSPQFKAYIPLMAEHFGFEVGFVTYRWPWWLQRQTEKQRKIWAYKILFLDVIFPLDVDRVIFVDADQTDRADLHELYNLDAHGSPIAMTPFCEQHKNNATVGFRFWREGFWPQHLRSKPYHISAIFLVDLHRFRAMGAGNVYRSTYAGLVQDPNSLANLDQDLPNYVQARVPIYSLPEEWLWCETWCSAESKKSAKTIDLCNNPLTKMPKLDNAKMIVPGWEEQDDMLEDLAMKLSAEVRNG